MAIGTKAPVHYPRLTLKYMITVAPKIDISFNTILHSHITVEITRTITLAYVLFLKYICIYWIHSHTGISLLSSTQLIATHYKADKTIPMWEVGCGLVLQVGF